jgi:hypothetical protein
MKKRYEISLDDTDPGQARIMELLDNLGRIRPGFIRLLLAAYVDRYGTTLPGMEGLFAGAATPSGSEHAKEKLTAPAPAAAKAPETETLRHFELKGEPVYPLEEVRMQPDPTAEKPKQMAETPKQDATAAPQPVDRTFLQNALAGILGGEET